MKWEWSDFGYAAPSDISQIALDAVWRALSAPPSQLVDIVIGDAVEMNAPEIELRECETHLAMSYRVADSLVDRDEIPLKLLPGLVRQLKNLCKQSEEGPLTDGEFRFVHPVFETDVRVIVSPDDKIIRLRLAYGE